MFINLLRDGVAIEIIASATGRSIEDLRKLKQEQGISTCTNFANKKRTPSSTPSNLRKGNPEDKP
jgi:hypothetical protein